MDMEGPDLTARMRRLIWAFAVRIFPKTRFCITRPTDKNKNTRRRRIKQCEQQIKLTAMQSSGQENDSATQTKNEVDSRTADEHNARLKPGLNIQRFPQNLLNRKQHIKR